MANNSNEEHKFYFVLANTTFKERYTNHIRDLKNQKHQNSTELAEYVWQLKHSNISFHLMGVLSLWEYQFIFLQIVFNRKPLDHQFR